VINGQTVKVRATLKLREVRKEGRLVRPTLRLVHLGDDRRNLLRRPLQLGTPDRTEFSKEQRILADSL
jgi:hypothetical protein